MKYKVNLVTITSTQVEVEANDRDHAIELAFDSALPFAPAFAGYEFGDWSLASELFPGSDPEDDVYEVEE